MSATNETTKQILNYLFEQRIYAWRQNTAGIPLPSGGFRPAAKTGVGDIIIVFKGRHIEVEIKSGKDRLRPEQIGHGINLKRAGGLQLVVKDFPDFLFQFENIT